MFTIEQITEAHTKVKTGADFPAYIQEIKELGVTAFETWVTDNHTRYFGKDDYQTKSEPIHEALAIADQSDPEKFEHYLKSHQQGETDYAAFLRHCAETGIEKWFVGLDTMTCKYYDKAGNEVLAEQIPG